jgi:hypothetical protein
MANSVRIGVGVDDKASGPIDRIRDKFESLGKSSTYKNLVTGVGLGLGQAAFNALAGAASGAADAIVGGAIREQQNIAKLDAALKANIANWDGNRNAIEKVIRTRENLAFSDDELRDSLAHLVAATHDVHEAFQIQSVAMDLARFKGISLAEATDALTKVEAGSYRILKSLGIALKDGATQQDALNAVQAVAAGQAEKYATTVEGKLTTAQIKFNDKMEDLGTHILPLVADALDLVVRGIDPVSVSMDDLAEAARRGSISAQARLNSLGNSVENLADDMTATKEAAAAMRGPVIGAAGSLRTFADRARAARDANEDYKDSLVKSADDLIDKYYDPILARDQLIANSAELTAQRKILASANSTAAEKRDARAAIHQIERDNLELRIGLLEAGKLNAKEQAALVDDLKKKIHAAKGPAKAALQEILDRVNALRLATKADFRLKFRALFSTNPTAGNEMGIPRASGGPVMPWQHYKVGEHGEEDLYLGQTGGFVVANGGSKPMALTGGMSMAGVAMTFNFFFPGMTVAPTQAQAAQMGDMVGPAIVNYFRARGLIPR